MRYQRFPEKAQKTDEYRKKYQYFVATKKLVNRFKSQKTKIGEEGDGFYQIPTGTYRYNDLDNYSIRELQANYAQVRQQVITDLMERANNLAESEAGEYIAPQPRGVFTIARNKKRISISYEILAQKNIDELVEIHLDLQNLETGKFDNYEKLRPPEKPFFGYSKLKHEIERHRTNNPHYDAINLWIDLNKYQTRTGKYLNSQEIWRALLPEWNLAEPEPEKRQLFNTLYKQYQNWDELEIAYGRQRPQLEQTLIYKRSLITEIQKIKEFCSVYKENGQFYYHSNNGLVSLSDCPVEVLQNVLEQGNSVLQQIINNLLTQLHRNYQNQVRFNDDGTLTTYRNGKQTKITYQFTEASTGERLELYQTLANLKNDMDFYSGEFSAQPPTPQRQQPQPAPDPPQPQRRPKRQGGGQRGGGWGIGDWLDFAPGMLTQAGIVLLPRIIGSRSAAPGN